MSSAIALDLGTTSIKAGLLDRHGVLAGVIARQAPQVTVSAGCCESDPLAYAALAGQALDECVRHEASRGAPTCETLGMCSQRSSFLIWERASGRPVTPLISWQDNRGAASCIELRAHEDLIRSLTGLPLTPYYFAPKLRVILRENPEWRAQLLSGELLVGTLDTFLIWLWTDGRSFVTDASMAARTLLMDIRLKQWSPQLCDFFGVPLSALPEIRHSTGLNIPLRNGLVLQSSVGDQSAALFAGVGVEGGEALVNVGTGCFVARYLPMERLSLDGYLRTLVYQDNLQQCHFAVEATLNSVAAALAPYPVGECRVEDLAAEDIFCLAEPSGLGAPYFRNDIGVCFSASVEHLSTRQLAGLLMEAVIFRVARALEDFDHVSRLGSVYLSGGLSKLSCLKQGIAVCAPCPVYRLEEAESSLRGAALLAAGMPPAYNRRSERIDVIGNQTALPLKYQRWKKWLDDLLTA